MNGKRPGRPVEIFGGATSVSFMAPLDFHSALCRQANESNLSLSRTVLNKLKDKHGWEEHSKIMDDLLNMLFKIIYLQRKYAEDAYAGLRNGEIDKFITNTAVGASIVQICGLNPEILKILFE